MDINFKNELKLAYDADAQRRDGNEKSREQWKLDIRSKFADLLRSQGSMSILELGSGVGIDAKFFEDAGFDVLATDLSESIVKLCQSRGLDAQVLDLYDIKNLDRKFDGVFSMNVLLHVPRKDLDQVLSSIKDAMIPGGIFFYGVYGEVDREEVITDRSKMNMPRFFSFLSDESIQEIAGRYFEIVEFSIVQLPYDKNELHFQSLWLRKPL